jgi:phosphoglycerate dehydrogenase-like enzyme
MPNVLIGSEPIRHQPGRFRDLLEEHGFAPVAPSHGGRLTEADLREYLPGCEAIVAGGEVISDSILEACPQLRVIARTGVGYDAVDIAAASERGIAVTITPGANQEAVAEHAFALLLALVKDVAWQDKAIREGKWDRTVLPRPLRGLTLGIVGLGRIGRAMATRALAFGMPVLATDPLADLGTLAGTGVELVGFDDLIARSDVVSLHLPVLESTRGLFDAAQIARMKPGSILVNTSRGALIDESALIEALRSGHLSGAALDVFNPEPPKPDNPLWQVKNVTLTPHMAGVDVLAMDEMALMAARCIVELHQGGWPAECVVNPEVAPGWKW